MFGTMKLTWMQCELTILFISQSMYIFFLSVRAAVQTNHGFSSACVMCHYAVPTSIRSHCFYQKCI